MSKQHYNIAFAIDSNFLKLATVCIYSLLKNNTLHYFNIFLLTDNPKSLEHIYTIIAKKPFSNYSNFSINIINPITQDYIKDYINKFQSTIDDKFLWSKEIQYKLFLPIIFPSLDKILFLDADVIINGDITDFLNTNIDNYFFCGDNVSKMVEDSNKVIFKHHSITKLPVASPENIKNTNFNTIHMRTNNADNTMKINAGVVLFNLKHLRENNAWVKLIEANMIDEGAINAVFPSKVLAAPLGYILTNHVIYIQPYNKSDARIIHLNAVKPWVLDRNLSLKGRGVGIWYKYLGDLIVPRYYIIYWLIKWYALTIGGFFGNIERRLKMSYYKFTLGYKKPNKSTILSKIVFVFSIINKNT